jgi:hypothetical protein
MKLRALGLAIAAAAITGLTATAAVADEPAIVDVVVNVIDSSLAAPENPDPTGGADEPTTDPTNEPTDETSDVPTADDTTSDDDETTGPLVTTGGGFIGSDPLLVAAALSGLAAAGLIIVGVRRKRDGKAFLPKAGLAAIGAAGLLAVGSLATFAAENTSGRLVITIDKANTMNGTLDLAYQLDEPMTYMALNGTATANPDITLSVNGTNLDPAIENQLLVSENPEGTDTIPYVLTATIDPNTPLGEYQASVNVTTEDLRGEITVNLEAEDKTYDGNTDAVVSAHYAAEINMDDDVQVDIDPELAGTFAQKDVADNIDVTVDPSLVTLSGEQAHRYYLTLVQPTANITPKELTLTGFSLVSKEFDNNYNLTEANQAQILAEATLDGVIDEDEVDLQISDAQFGEYNSKHVYDAESVDVTLFVTLEGAQADNYTIDAEYAAILPAEITPEPVTLAADPISKTFDGTADLTGTDLGDINSSLRAIGRNGLTAAVMLGVDSLEGTYNSANVTEAESAQIDAEVYLYGEDWDDFQLTSQSFQVEASITPKQLTWVNQPTLTKVYDGTTDLADQNDEQAQDWIAGRSGDPLDGLVPGFEDVQVSDLWDTASYNSKDRIDADHVTLSWEGDVPLDGQDASNYQVSTNQAELPASINAKSLSLSWPNPVTKEYNGNTNLTSANTSWIAAYATLEDALPQDNVSLDVTGSLGGSYNSSLVSGATRVEITLQVQLLGENTENYSLPPLYYAQIDASITQKPVSLEADPISKEFDGTNGLSTNNMNQLYLALRVVDDGSGVLPSCLYPSQSGKYTGSYNAATVADATSATITVDAYLCNGDQDNFTITSLTFQVKASITPKPLTWANLPTLTKEYDGTADMSAANQSDLNEWANNRLGDPLNGYVPGHNLVMPLWTSFSASYDSASIDATRVTVSFTGLRLSGPDADNYTLASQTAVTPGSITPKPVEVTGFSRLAKVYDGTTELTEANQNQLEAEATLDGTIEPDDVELNLEVSSSSSYDDAHVANVNEVDAQLTCSLDGTSADNYTIAADCDATIKAEITPKPINFKITFAKTYDSYAGGADLDSFDVESTGTAGTETVTPTALTVNGKTNVLTAINAKGADADEYDLGSSEVDTELVITYANGAIAEDYEVSAAYSWEIQPKPLLNATGTTYFTYDGNTNHLAVNADVFDVDVQGLIGNDKFDITPNAQLGLTTTAAAGTYQKGSRKLDGDKFTGAITSGNPDNYILPESFDHTVVITPKPLSVSVNTTLTKVYDGNDQLTAGNNDQLAAATQLVGAVPNDKVYLQIYIPSNPLYNASGVANAKAVNLEMYCGVYGDDSANYSVDYDCSKSVPASITKKPVTVSFSQPLIKKVYDGTVYLTSGNISALESAFTLNGKLSSDTVYVDAMVSGSYNSPNVLNANQASLQATVGLSGAAAGNYEVSSSWSGTTSAEIAKRQVWPTADPITKVFRGSTSLTSDNLNAIYFKDAGGARVTGLTASTAGGYYNAATVAGAYKATFTDITISDTDNNSLMVNTFEVDATITKLSLDYGIFVVPFNWTKPYNGKSDAVGVTITYDGYAVINANSMHEYAGAIVGYTDLAVGYNIAQIPALQSLLAGPVGSCSFEGWVGGDGYYLTGKDAPNYSIGRMWLGTSCEITAAAAPTSAPAPLKAAPLPIVSETPVVQKEKVTEEAVESTEAAVEPTEAAKLDPPVVEGKQEDTDPVTEAKPEDDTDEAVADDDGDLGDGAN